MSTITIQDTGNGSYTVQQQGDEQEPQGQPTQPQTANSVDEVCQIVQQILGEESGEGNPQAMWDQEAAKRQPQQPAAGDSGAQGGPSMSL
jgi:hypothetical protein